MKNKYSQNLPEHFGEDPSKNSDDSLLSFLKKNKLIAPPPAPDFEQQLFAEISKYPPRSPQLFPQRWLLWAVLIPTAIATGIAFNWATNRSQYQMANNATLNQISEVDKSAIEQSLISSWSATDGSTSNATTSTDTQLLIELSPLEYE